MINPEQIKDLIEVDSDSDRDDNDDLIYHDMEIFCHAINEPQLAEPLKKHKVTLYQLLNFDESDLINCGIELVGDRKKILDNTAQAHCEKWAPTSLHDLTAKSFLTAPGIYISLNDMNKHLEYIGLTLTYLRKQLQRKPDILELGKDYVGIGKIISELEDLQKTSKSTQNQIVMLAKKLNSQLGNPHLIPANHIDEKYLRKAKIGRLIVPTILGSVVICITFQICKYF